MDQKTTEKLKELTKKTNRSFRQTQMLYDLVDKDFEKLKKLEVQIKNCFVNYCPATKNEVDKIMKAKPKSDYFNLERTPTITLKKPV